MLRAVLLATTLALAACGGPGDPVALPSVTSEPPAVTASASATEESPSPSASPTPSATPSRTRRATPRPTRTPTRAPAPPPAPATKSLAAFHDLGTWVDGYDFSREFGGSLRPSDVDTMAARGVRTIYLQAAKEDERSPELLLSRDLLGQWLERAHARGMKVVAWYLPTFVDPARDWAHVEAMLRFRSGGHAFDAIGIDIESRELPDAALRGERLVALSTRLRNAAPRMTLQGIVLPPVVTDVINKSYWPGFPWKRIAPLYDVWTPMAYWTNRTPESGWRDAYRYTAENIRMTRANLGRPSAVVHVAGGIGNKTTVEDIQGFARAARDQRAIGGSLYDYATTAASAWPHLRAIDW